MNLSNLLRRANPLGRFLRLWILVCAIPLEGCLCATHLFASKEVVTDDRVETGRRVHKTTGEGSASCSIRLKLDESGLAVDVRRQYIGTHQIEHDFKATRHERCDTAIYGRPIWIVIGLLEVLALPLGILDLGVIMILGHRTGQCRWESSIPDLVESESIAEPFDEMRPEPCTVEFEFQSLGKWQVACGTDGHGALKLGPEHAKNALLGRDTQVVARVVEHGVAGSATLTISSADFRKILEGRR